MFEKITSVAEKLATSVSESRRGFLGRLGQIALGAAGAVGGLLALPKDAQAAVRTGYCITVSARPGGAAHYTGRCLSLQTCQSGLSSACQGNVFQISTACGKTYDPTKPCSF